MFDVGLIAASGLHKAGWSFSVFQRSHRGGSETFVVAAVRDGRTVAVCAATLDDALAEASRQAQALAVSPAD